VIYLTFWAGLEYLAQMALDPNSSPYTAFSCGTNHYEFTRLAYGLKAGAAKNL
jgi:hypothetical protein